MTRARHRAARSPTDEHPAKGSRPQSARADPGMSIKGKPPAVSRPLFYAGSQAIQTRSLLEDGQAALTRVAIRLTIMWGGRQDRLT